MGFDKFTFGGFWIFPVIVCIGMMIYFLLRSRRGGFKPPWMQDSDEDNKKNKDSETPLELLRKRYAKGEITKKEFDNIKEDLEK